MSSTAVFMVKDPESKDHCRSRNPSQIFSGNKVFMLKFMYEVLLEIFLVLF